MFSISTYISVARYISKQLSCVRWATVTASVCFRSLKRLWCPRLHFTSSVFHFPPSSLSLTHNLSCALSLLLSLFPSHLPSRSLLICSVAAFAHWGLGATLVTLCKMLHKKHKQCPLIISGLQMFATLHTDTGMCVYVYFKLNKICHGMICRQVEAFYHHSLSSNAFNTSIAKSAESINQTHKAFRPE